MTDELSKKFHGVGIGPLSKILAVKLIVDCTLELHAFLPFWHFENAILNEGSPTISNLSKRLHPRAH